MEPEPEPQQVTDLVRFNAYNSAFIVTQQGIVYPFELIKTRVQIAPAHGGSELAAMRTVARGVIADRGVVRGLYHGFPWLAGPLLMCEAVYYTLYIVIKKAMHDFSGRHVAPQHRETADFVIPFAAGGLAEAGATIVSVPTDILTQRLQILPRNHAGSAPAVLRSVVKEQGLSGLYRGTTVTIASCVPFSAVWFCTYEALKGAVARLDRENKNAADALVARAGRGSAGTESPWREHLVHASCGTVAAIVSVVLTNPIDVVKTRMQTHGAPSYLSVSQQGNGTADAKPTFGQVHSLRQRHAWYHLRYQKHLMQQAGGDIIHARRFCTSGPTADMPSNPYQHTGVRINTRVELVLCCLCPSPSPACARLQVWSRS